MDVRVTPISGYITSTKCKPGTPAIYQQNRVSSFNTDRGGSKQNVLLTSNSQLNKPIPDKRTGAANNLLLVARKGTSTPQGFLKVNPDVNHAQAAQGNKKIMLYQQIERNKALSNNAELVNRFNYKV